MGVITTLDGKVVVGGAGGVGQGADMVSVKDVDMDSRTTKARNFGQGGSQESQSNTISRLEVVVVCMVETGGQSSRKIDGKNA